jgi:hypothetical protein
MGSELKIRRVVTGHNARGRAVVLKDGVIQGREVLGGEASFAVIWKTISSPVDNDDADRAAEPVGATKRERAADRRHPARRSVPDAPDELARLRPRTVGRAIA